MSDTPTIADLERDFESARLFRLKTAAPNEKVNMGLSAAECAIAAYGLRQALSLARENAALRSELEGVRKDVAIFREALIHIGQHMQTDEQSAYMPLNEWIGHASVDDARKRDRELIDAAIAQGKGEK